MHNLLRSALTLGAMIPIAAPAQEWVGSGGAPIRYDLETQAPFHYSLRIRLAAVTTAEPGADPVSSEALIEGGVSFLPIVDGWNKAGRQAMVVDLELSTLRAELSDSNQILPYRIDQIDEVTNVIVMNPLMGMPILSYVVEETDRGYTLPDEFGRPRANRTLVFEDLGREPVEGWFARFIADLFIPTSTTATTNLGWQIVRKHLDGENRPPGGNLTGQVTVLARNSADVEGQAVMTFSDVIEGSSPGVPTESWQRDGVGVFDLEGGHLISLRSTTEFTLTGIGTQASGTIDIELDLAEGE